MTTEPLLRVENLRKYFPFTKGILFAKTIGVVKAVDDISFSINAARHWAWSVSQDAARQRHRG